MSSVIGCITHKNEIINTFGNEIMILSTSKVELNHKLCGESGGADVEAADRFIIEFKNLLLQENLTDTQVYNMDETT
ncbi:hypothetical protein A3Q56_00028 [Intoshia linei]|uniref:Uncharacterized protein n=1 Tax=Intoshia linei TaxID=1819745 RepID=A0A177BF57_9BILA|nr:hypothetical protein A3Q56_00028 [Intoshia linei]